MMILQQQFQGDDDDDDGSDIDSHKHLDDDQERDQEKGDSNDNMNDVKDSEEEEEDGDGKFEEGEFSSEDEEEMAKENACSGGSGAKAKKLKSEVAVENDVKAHEMMGERLVGKDDDDVDDKEQLSDYASDENDDIGDAIDQVAEANESKGRENGHRNRTNNRLSDMLADVIASCSPGSNGHGHDSITPPDANWSESDDCDDDSKKCNVEEFLKCGVRASNSDVPRKHRYSSNTSVDTSTTSGIGSYNEEHLDAEMAPSDSEKTSPGWSHGEYEHTVSKRSGQPMDIEENDEEEEDLDDDIPKITLSMCMKEDIESLPLPSALKSYLRYYRV